MAILDLKNMIKTAESIRKLNGSITIKHNNKRSKYELTIEYFTVEPVSRILKKLLSKAYKDGISRK